MKNMVLRLDRKFLLLSVRNGLILARLRDALSMRMYVGSVWPTCGFYVGMLENVI